MLLQCFQSFDHSLSFLPIKHFHRYHHLNFRSFSQKKISGIKLNKSIFQLTSEKNKMKKKQTLSWDEIWISSIHLHYKEKNSHYLLLMRGSSTKIKQGTMKFEKENLVDYQKEIIKRSIAHQDKQNKHTSLYSHQIFFPQHQKISLHGQRPKSTSS